MDLCNFADGVDSSLFESERLLLFTPHDGELTLMNYRIKHAAAMPFKITPTLTEIAPGKVRLAYRTNAEESPASAVLCLVSRFGPCAVVAVRFLFNFFKPPDPRLLLAGRSHGAPLRGLA